jgi:hypothetical protein
MSQRAPFLLAALAAGLFSVPARAETPADAAAAGDIAKIFAQALADSRPKGPDLDRDRGLIVFDAATGRYDKGLHFGRWHWPEFTGDRWGAYHVEVTYTATTSRMGFQFYLGDAKAKGYLAQSGSMEEERTAVLDRLYLPDTATRTVGVLSGEDSNGTGFQLKRIALRPAPEGDEPAQAIDGTVHLAARDATTFSRRMRYEPKPEKDCLGFWTEVDDWAEWNFAVHDGGPFTVQVLHGCGGGNHGSEVAVWINDVQRTFTVADTGGYQSWKPADLGAVDLPAGTHRLVVKPLTKAKGGILDVHRIVLTPKG